MSSIIKISSWFFRSGISPQNADTAIFSKYSYLRGQTFQLTLNCHTSWLHPQKAPGTWAETEMWIKHCRAALWSCSSCPARGSTSGPFPGQPLGEAQGWCHCGCPAEKGCELGHPPSLKPLQLIQHILPEGTSWPPQSPGADTHRGSGQINPLGSGQTQTLNSDIPRGLKWFVLGF